MFLGNLCVHTELGLNSHNVLTTFADDQTNHVVRHSEFYLVRISGSRTIHIILTTRRVANRAELLLFDAISIFRVEQSLNLHCRLADSLVAAFQIHVKLVFVVGMASVGRASIFLCSSSSNKNLCAS